MIFFFFYAPVSKDRGHIVLPLSVCLHKLNMKTSRGTKVKVICKGQGQISGSCLSKDGCFKGISVSQIHLVFEDYFYILVFGPMMLVLPTFLF